MTPTGNTILKSKKVKLSNRMKTVLAQCPCSAAAAVSWRGRLEWSKETTFCLCTRTRTRKGLCRLILVKIKWITDGKGWTLDAKSQISAGSGIGKNRCRPKERRNSRNLVLHPALVAVKKQNESERDQENEKGRKNRGHRGRGPIRKNWERTVRTVSVLGHVLTIRFPALGLENEGGRGLGHLLSAPAYLLWGLLVHQRKGGKVVGQNQRRKDVGGPILVVPIGLGKINTKRNIGQM